MRKLIFILICLLYVNTFPQSSAIIITVDGLDFYKIFGKKIIREGKEIKFEDLQCSFLDWDNYLGEALKPLELENSKIELAPFVWEESSAYSDYYVRSLHDFLLEQFNKAKKNNKKFIVVAHSWGTFLAYAALSPKYNDGSNPIQCDLLITLGSPLGTEYANKNKIKDPFEDLIKEYVIDWLDLLKLKRSNNSPIVKDWYNFWNWGDMISGPIKNRESNVMDLEILPKFLPSSVNKLFRNTVSTYLWHKYNSLQPYGKIDNSLLIEKIYELIKKSLASTDTDKKITLGFILDSSGSMAQNDPQDMRKSAIEMILNQLNGNENIFLVDFDDHSNWLNPNNYENYNKELLKDDIRRVNSDGGTEIGGGLVTMQNAIETTNNTKSKGGIILLTDGKNNNAFNYSLLDWYKQNDFPVSTVSFVGDVDNKLLSDIAAMTKGNYFRAINAYDVVMYFREFLNSISGNSSLTLFRNIIQQGESQSCSFYVDGGMGFIFAGTNWSGSKIKLKLISPSNRTFTENDNDGEWNIGSNFVSVKMLNPDPGKWKAEFYGENIPSGGEEYVFQVTGDSPTKIEIEDKLLVSGQMQFSLQSFGKGNFSNVKSKIEVNTPTDRKEDISNSFSNNGFSYRPRDGQGNYNFEISLTGKDGSGSTIQRYFARTILVGEGTPSNIAPVKLMEGNYLYADLGLDIGNFAGLECIIYSQKGNVPIASGYVTFVNDTECTIEIQSFLSGESVNVGDVVELNVTQWQQDF